MLQIVHTKLEIAMLARNVHSEMYTANMQLIPALFYSWFGIDGRQLLAKYGCVHDWHWVVWGQSSQEQEHGPSTSTLVLALPQPTSNVKLSFLCVNVPGIGLDDGIL